MIEHSTESTLYLPQWAGYNDENPVVTQESESVYSSGDNFLLKNEQGLWELSAEGDPLERGLAIGSLTESLMQSQERIFFSKINDWVPSKSRQKLLRAFLRLYNRKIHLNVPEEFKVEIYGVSRYTSREFDHIAPRYLRSLYLHGAHDIGHALQDLALVGCSSFACWGEKSEDGGLIIGRNFDFYVSDDFARNKLISFIRPDKGFPFMMVSWPGMIGTVSGMNAEGLTVTINAGKSKIPLLARTPISILCREILQYAGNIEQAIAIANKREVFVSESIMVGSAYDKKAVLVEVSPGKSGCFSTEGNQLICTNHFQSDAFKNNDRNNAQIRDSHSQYRYDRLIQLLSEHKKINPTKAAAILRDKDGINGRRIGYGNEKALNQLRAHHGIIFKPEQRQVWVSANPYQLGELVCYDLNEIFARDSRRPVATLQQQNLNISKDPFLETDEYANYELFRQEDIKMDLFLKAKIGLDPRFIAHYQSLNPDYWVVYYKVGLYYYQIRDYQSAKPHFEKALTKEITTLPEKDAVEKYLSKLKNYL